MRIREGDRTREVEVREPETVAGRGKSSPLRLPHDDVSRRHALFRLTEKGFSIEDLGSSNGTFLNGERIEGEHPLAPGDLLGFGPVRVEVLSVPANGAPEPPPPGPDPEPAAAAGPEPFRLLLKDDEGEREVVLDRPEITVGRSRKAGLRIRSSDVSRAHARLRWDGKRLHVEDLGSANGTFVGEERLVGAREIGHGAVVVFGSTRAEVIGPEAVAAAAASQPDAGKGKSATLPGRRVVSLDRPKAGSDLVKWMVAAVVLLVVAIGVRQARRSGAPAVPESPPPSRNVTRGDADAPGAAGAVLAERAMNEFRAVAAEEDRRPEDLQSFRRAYESILGTYPGTEGARLAAGRLEGIDRRLQEIEEEAFERVARRVGAAVASGRFNEGRDLLLGFMQEHPGGGMVERVEIRLAEIETAVREAERELLAGIARARTAGEFAEARSLLDRYARLGGSGGLARVSEIAREIDAEERLHRRRLEAERMERQEQAALQAAQQSAQSAAEAERLRREEEARLDAERREREMRFRELESTWVRDAVREIPRGDSGARRASFAEVEAFGLPYAEETSAELAGLHARLVDRLERAFDRKKGDLQASARSDLASRRRAALALIEDESRYPGADKAASQAEVDRLVGAVRALYAPGPDALRGMDGLSEWVVAIEEVEGYLGTIGSRDRIRKPLDAVLEGLAEAFREGLVADEFGADGVRILEMNEALYARLLAAGTLNAEEVACMRATNRYRMMLGRAPLEILETLIRSSQAHSKDMVQRNYFSHNSPDGRTPTDRMHAAGFPGYGGENIAHGHPGGVATLDQWLHSPGHHRNILRDRYRYLGVGNHQRHWTQNFGNG